MLNLPRLVNNAEQSRGFHAGFLLNLATILLLAGSVMLSGGEAIAQAKAAKVEIPAPQPQVLVTKDNVNLYITYYKSIAGKESPVVVLLHMSDGNRFIWQTPRGFAEQMQLQGYAVITVDLRGHGESKGGIAGANVNQDPKKKKPAAPPKKGSRPVEELNPADYGNMVTQDMEAVKKFIKDEHQAEHLNMNKMGIVGPEMGAAVAAEFAAVDWLKAPYADAPPTSGQATPKGQDVRALVLISPQSKFPPGLQFTRSLQTLRSKEMAVAFMFAVAKNDDKDKGETKKLYDIVAAFDKEAVRTYLQDEYPAKLRGTDMLGKGLKVEEQMMGFFNKHLKTLPPNWRDRRSKLDRD